MAEPSSVPVSSENIPFLSASECFRSLRQASYTPGQLPRDLQPVTNGLAEFQAAGGPFRQDMPRRREERSR